jgi:protein arginine N-methyltransferase 1
MYSLRDYGNMIADRVRMDPYAYALKDAIGPDTVVLDIGAATGIHALLAAKFGARKVYAVELNDAIHLAKDLATANGYAQRIEFFQELSTQITLPEKADVVVSDLRGALPLFGNHIQSIVDARQRHLAPGGQLIPLRDILWVALVETRTVYRDLVKPWDHPYGLDMEIAKQIVLNSWSDEDSSEVRLRNLLVEPQIWATLDYASIVNPNVGISKLSSRVKRDGIAHGLLIWFDAEIGKGLGFSNGPQETRIADVYGRGFFPLLEPVHVNKGDIVVLDISAEHNDDGYDWQWHTRIADNNDPSFIKANFKQSSYFEVT